MNSLAAIYNVWDDDHLEASIKHIRPHVDEIIIVYQDISNKGEEYSPSLPEADKIIKYEPDLSKKPAWNETRKRQIGLEAANSTHFLMMDCDEFYQDFEKWKIEAMKYDSSACKLFTYYKYPTHQLDPPEEYFVPFIHRKTPCKKMGGLYPVFADPTRTVNPVGRFLKIEERIMHHMSFIRKDIGKKFRNSSSVGAYSNWQKHVKTFADYEKTGEMVLFGKRGIKIVDNQFLI